MQADPLVTIVTPAFNQAHFLAETIESVLAQTYKNMEYIVINDGSTDETAGVLQKYADHIIGINQTNVGQAQTLNKGWRLAKGQILGYLSSDDLLDPRAVELCVRALTDSPESVVAYPDYNLIDAGGQIIRRVSTEEFSRSRLTVDLVCQPGPGALFLRSAYERVGGWKPELKQVPDFEFWLRMSTVGDFKRVPAVLASWRWHAESASVRPLDENRCNELVRVMHEFWNGQDSAESRRSLARAHVISSAAHFRSGRWTSGIAALKNAAKMAPKTTVSFRNVSCALGGIWRGIANYPSGR